MYLLLKLLCLCSCAFTEKGLKSEIVAKVKVDSLTYKEHTDIDKAQSVACNCALDAHDSSAAAAQKRAATDVVAQARGRPQAKRLHGLLWRVARDVCRH